MAQSEIILSFCIPIYNERKTLEKSLRKIDRGLSSLMHNRYEILVADNGSTDNPSVALQGLKNKHIRFFSLPQKGQGAAYRECIRNAQGMYVILSAIDLPFGFNDLAQAMKVWNKVDLIFGSKKHPQSEVTVPIQRKVASFLYGALIAFLFNSKVRDTQGTIVAKTSRLKKILDYCTATDAFFTAQLAIYAQREKMKIKEIPVTYKSKGNRKSKYNVITDGSGMLKSMILEFFKLRFFSKTP